MKLLIATHNQGKVKEIAQMLADAKIECLSLSDANVTFDVDETGTTFLDNATLKAVQYAQLTNLPTLADDSGLEVDALNGEPGVYTARYGGKELSQPERNQFLLQNLKNEANRGARFQCMMVLCDPTGKVQAQEQGTLEGEIGFEPRGEHGFGYDPVFVVDGRTLAEREAAEKKLISHRGRALFAILPSIEKLLTNSG